MGRSEADKVEPRRCIYLTVSTYTPQSWKVIREPTTRSLIVREARPESSSGLSEGGARDRDLLPAARRTRVNGHDRGADQANRMLGHGPYHLLASLTTNQASFSALSSHVNPSPRA